jgi:hypothetical protein
MRQQVHMSYALVHHRLLHRLDIRRRIVILVHHPLVVIPIPRCPKRPKV